MRWTAALFDMDGTISDSVGCIAGALRLMAVDLGVPGLIADLHAAAAAHRTHDVAQLRELVLG